MKQVWLWLMLLMFWTSGFSFAQDINSTPLQLAKSFDLSNQDISLGEYLVSEKLDGIRARWNGNSLVTRKGNLIAAPDWFVANWPEHVLDGELWIARGKFELTASIVLSDTPDQRWENVRFMAFDMPEFDGPFKRRVSEMTQLVLNTDSASLAVIPQYTLHTFKALNVELERVVAGGGEGLMLHHRDAYYENGRSDNLLKVKRYEDDEARVIGYIEGKGKFSGKMGSLLVETSHGVQFKLGSGFSDVQRERPPDIGSWVTFKYYGLTRNGKPRFASFIRVRPDKDIASY